MVLVVMLSWLCCGDILKCCHQSSCSRSLFGQHGHEPIQAVSAAFPGSSFAARQLLKKSVPWKWMKRAIVHLSLLLEQMGFALFFHCKTYVCISQFFIESVTRFLIRDTESHWTSMKLCINKIQAVVNRPSL